MSVGGKGGKGGARFPSVSISASTPAFRLSGSGSLLDISTNLQRLGSVPQQEFDLRFPRILTDLDALRGTITPGFSKLREARLAAVEGARQRDIGTLRGELARRRLQGSSFALDTETRAEREFAEAKAGQEALSFLEELDANRVILESELNVVGTGLQRELNELALVSGFTDSVRTAAASAAEMAAKASASRGSLIGSLVGTLAPLAFDFFAPGAGTAAAATASTGVSAGGLNNLLLRSGVDSLGFPLPALR